MESGWPERPPSSQPQLVLLTTGLTLRPGLSLPPARLP
jgi:hypothetical protein